MPSRSRNLKTKHCMVKNKDESSLIDQLECHGPPLIGAQLLGPRGPSNDVASVKRGSIYRELNATDAAPCPLGQAPLCSVHLLTGRNFENCRPLHEAVAQSEISVARALCYYRAALKRSTLHVFHHYCIHQHSLTQFGSNTQPQY